MPHVRWAVTYRLVNSANDCEAGPRKPAQQLHHSQSRLGIESSRRLVTEEDRWPTDHLDSDSSALSLLRIETSRSGADDRILNGREIQQIKDDVNVGELDLARNARVLSQ